MFTLRYKSRSFSVRLAAGIVVAVVFFAARAWAGDCCSSNKRSGGQDPGARADAHQDGERQPAPTRPASIVSQPPHGGQVYASNGQYFEVVYLRPETRVYLYGEDQRPVSASGVQGQVVMEVQGNDHAYRYPLQPVAAATGSDAEDRLAASVDVSRIRDGDMRVTFHLVNLPDSRQPAVSFTQVFALTPVQPTVTVARLEESDRAAVARQRVCPVLGGPLGGMGTPVKVLVGDQPVYLCCRGCVAKVRDNPEKYVAKVRDAGEKYVATPVPARQHPAQAASGGKLTVTEATATDQAAIRAQGTCAVLNSQLGSMGTPVKVAQGGQSLFLCCKGCVSKVEKNPDYYFARAARLRSGG